MTLCNCQGCSSPSRFSSRLARSRALIHLHGDPFDELVSQLLSVPFRQPLIPFDQAHQDIDDLVDMLRLGDQRYERKEGGDDSRDESVRRSCSISQLCVRIDARSVHSLEMVKFFEMKAALRFLLLSIIAGLSFGINTSQSTSTVSFSSSSSLSSSSSVIAPFPCASTSSGSPLTLPEPDDDPEDSSSPFSDLFSQEPTLALDCMPFWACSFANGCVDVMVEGYVKW